MDDATRAQTLAANPATSTWLGANAGSGKTRVLTDRVARLLLGNVRPERILCLTYTKAAAMEMQNRLFSRLGAWAMKDDADLRETLESIGVRDTSPDQLDAARTLFARAIEAPGGLKIQTIHSFCASILRRFPLEARVSPGFTEIDGRQQARLIVDLLDDLAETEAGQSALALASPHLSGEEHLVSLAHAVVGAGNALSQPATWEDICAWSGIPADLTEQELIRQILHGDEGKLATLVQSKLDLSIKTQARLHDNLDSINWSDPTLADLSRLESIFLFQSGAKAFQPKIDGIANAKVRANMGDTILSLNALMDRVAAARPLRTGLLTARRTYAMHRFADVFLPAHAQAKEARGWLDFDDLIDKTRALLSDPRVAQWVLFRLDGGIDHILVDEAQDTSPRQWDIVQRLAEDFAAGAGARSEVSRTVFVVGDKKQSIYSFQGADPKEFDRMRDYFADQLIRIKAPFQDAALIHSFRSAPPILELVDRVAARLGAPGLGGGVEHRAFFNAKPGRVDLWPHIAPAEKPTPPDWDDPQDLISEDHHSTILAQTLAARIADMLETPVEIAVEREKRPLTAGDILILVRRRSPLFHRIIAALKAKGLPVAGVDRSQLTSPLAVKDLMALCRFLATPEDDLSLAAVLRSPLVGMDEAQLFDLAYGRAGYLWAALRDRAETFPEAHAILKDLRDQVDFALPYELLERALIRHDGRRRLIARLGTEAHRWRLPLLAQALIYETNDVPSLTGFVGWLEAGEVQVKRDLSQASDEIRVMTVHGAKGLEAPVVILPDCAAQQSHVQRIKLLQAANGSIAWAPPAGDEIDAIRVADEVRKQRDAEEANRLLYVALTRAESWLIIAAAGPLGKAEAGSWYNIVSDAMDRTGARSLCVPGLEGTGLRLETGSWMIAPQPECAGSSADVRLADWTAKLVSSSSRSPEIRTPSDLGGAKALPGEGEDTEAALRRGTIIHLLLERLPLLPPSAWRTAAPGLIAALGKGEPEKALNQMVEEAISVLANPALKDIFSPDTLAEVEVTGHSITLECQMLGVIDRLIVTDTQVLAIDFKTNSNVPPDVQSVPEGLLRQMGAYSELLHPLYPDRAIVSAILWTRTGTLMELPHDLVSESLSRARGA